MIALKTNTKAAASSYPIASEDFISVRAIASDIWSNVSGTTFSGENLQTTINNLVPSAILASYPVGSIYITTSSSVNPASIMGGTWSKLSSGYTLGCYSDTYPIVGEATTLTLADGTVSHWDHIFHQDTSSNGVFTSSNWGNTGALTDKIWSRLDLFGSQVSHVTQAYEFWVRLNNSTENTHNGRWRQKANFLYHNPWNGFISYAMTDSTDVGYEDENNSVNNYLQGLYVPWKNYNNWKGLSLSRNGSAKAVGNCNTNGDWWYGLATTAIYNGGIPWPNGSAAGGISTVVDLYVRIDNMYNQFNTTSTADQWGESAHTLTVYEIADHAHTTGNRTCSGGSSASDAGRNAAIANRWSGTTGSSTAHNNMQPYITACAWVRTA